MSTGTIESPLKEKPTVADRVIDRARRAAHFSHEAQVLKSLAADAVDDGVYAAKRAVKSAKRSMVELADAKDDLTLRIKHNPITAVAVAAGAGLLIGFAAGTCRRMAVRSNERGCAYW